MIKAENLGKYFDKGKKQENHVLKDITIEFPETGFVCILGESGSGKTTLLNVLGGLDDFQKGSFSVDGQTFSGYDPRVIEPMRNNVFGYVFQNYYLLMNHTVEYNCMLPLSNTDMSFDAKKRRVGDVLERLGMRRYRNKKVANLSGGQMQRVSIARALVKTPRVLLADEPTGNLDEENTINTMSILKSISEKCLVILVSHERRIADFFCDRIIEISDGKIIKDYKNKPATDGYVREDDSNIYLKELEKTVFKDGENEFTIYGSRREETPVRLSFSWKDGRLYIKNEMKETVVFEGEESGVRMIDDYAPKIELDKLERFDSDFDDLNIKKSTGLKLKDMWMIAVDNLKAMGKKKLVLFLMIFMEILLLTFSFSGYLDSINIKKEDVVTTDSHYVQVKMALKKEFRTNMGRYEDDLDGDYKTLNECEKLYNQVFAKSKYADITGMDPDTKLELSYYGYFQLHNASATLKNMSYVDEKYLDEKSLIAGRTVQKDDEIVVDKAVLERFMREGNILSNRYKSVKEFLNIKVKDPVNGREFHITGISDNGEMSVYCKRRMALVMAISKEEYDRASTLQNGAKVELSDEKLMLTDVSRRKKFVIYFDDVEKGYNEVKKYTSGINKNNGSRYEWQVSVPYDTQIQKEIKKKQKEVKNMLGLSVVISLVVILIMAFMMQVNVTARREDLTVYRLMGIRRSSIVWSYVMEMTSVTVLISTPVVILSSLILRFMKTIPAQTVNFYLPWFGCICLMILVIFINALLSAIPARVLLSKPPAGIASLK